MLHRIWWVEGVRDRGRRSRFRPRFAFLTQSRAGIKTVLTHAARRPVRPRFVLRSPLPPARLLLLLSSVRRIGAQNAGHRESSRGGGQVSSGANVKSRTSRRLGTKIAQRNRVFLFLSRPCNPLRLREMEAGVESCPTLLIVISV